MSSRQALGPTQLPVQWVRGAVYAGVKRPGHEAYHSPPTSAEVKKTWVYTFPPPYVFMVYCLISFHVGDNREYCVADVTPCSLVEDGPYLQNRERTRMDRVRPGLCGWPIPKR
jgi:hypothetical protein